MKLGKINKIKILAACLAATACIAVHGGEAEAAGETKIHFIGIMDGGDAILLESNGHFGMVDSGEDWDYPDSEEYPLRSGTTTHMGYEQQVIHYLEKQGVKKLDFYIASHAHSDHIGSGDEILNYFPTERLYIGNYSDDYIRDESHLWDNKYVYDSLINAAKANGTQVITNLDLSENKPSLTFKMGDMQIEIMNAEKDRDENGNYLSVPDENCNSLVTKIIAYDKVALLTADLDPWVRDGEEYGDTVRVVNQLIEELWAGEEIEVPDVKEEEEYDDIDDYQVYRERVMSTPENGSWNYNSKSISSNVIDESKVNTGKTISIDLLKMPHHGVNYNNTTYFLTSINPKVAVVTGDMSIINNRERDCMPNTEFYSTAEDAAAVVATFTEEPIDTQYEKLDPEWAEINGQWYYFDENGRVFKDQKAHEIDDKVFYFDEQGAVYTDDCWVMVNEKWRYWLTDGEYFKGDWLREGDDWYYFEQNGDAVTGWKEIKGNWFYFYENCKLATNTWIGSYYLNGDGIWEPEATRDEWVLSGNRWWYRHGDGSYTTSDWELIDGSRYYFDEAGWMVTGWQWIEDKCYYLASNGALATDAWIGDYYVNEAGEWEPEATRDEWVLSGNRWRYCHGDGSYTTSDWELINGSWYYFDEAGWMVTGWQWVEDKCYYLTPSGALAVDTWIDAYYVDESGAWVPEKTKGQWILSGDRWWYQHLDRTYTTSDWELINGNWYYFDEAGWMVTGWKQIDQEWYYMYADGIMAANVWVGNYFLKGNGVMAKAEWVDNDNYYVDENGVYDPQGQIH